MAWVAWWGKALVFVAGIAVVIDLVDPAGLRRFGMRMNRHAVPALRRRRHRVHLSRVAGLRHEVPRLFVHRVFHGHDEGGEMYTHLVESPPSSSPVPWIDAGSFVAFWRTVMAEIHDRFDVRNGRGDLDGVPGYVQHRVDELLRTTAPQQRRWLVDRATLSEARAVGICSLGMLAGLSLTVAAAAMAARDVGTDLSKAVVGAAGLILTVTFVALMVVDMAAPSGLASALGGVGALGWRMVAWPALWGGRMLNRTRPLHPFRWIAFALFSVGSLMELLASFPPGMPP